MTTRLLKGSKQEIAKELASLEGEVREVIVFIEEPIGARVPADQTVEDIFAEMEPYMVNVGDADYSRAGIYSKKPGE